MTQSFAGKIFLLLQLPIFWAKNAQSQNFALQIGLELLMDRDPLPQKTLRR